MSEEKKKSSGNGLSGANETYVPRPLFSERGTAPRQSPATALPLFSEHISGKSLDGSVMPKSKPLMAKAVLRVRISVSVEELQQANPTVSQAVCVAAKQLIEAARLESDYVDETVKMWGVDVLERLADMSAQARTLLSDTRVAESGLCLQTMSETLSAFVSVRASSTWSIPFLSDSRKEKSEAAFRAIGIACHAVDELAERLSQTLLRFQKFSQACEACVETPIIQDIAGRHLIQILRSRLDDESRGYADILESRVNVLRQAMRTLHELLLPVWSRQAQVSNAETYVRELISQLLTWGEACRAFLHEERNAPNEASVLAAAKQLIDEIQTERNRP